MTFKARGFVPFLVVKLMEIIPWDGTAQALWCYDPQVTIDPVLYLQGKEIMVRRKCPGLIAETGLSKSPLTQILGGGDVKAQTWSMNRG